MLGGLLDRGSSASGQAGARGWLVWVVGPALLGLVVGLVAALMPWAATILAILVAGSGLAWILRVASDWFAEWAGPRQGVVMLASILLGTWIVLAFSAPEPLRRLGFGGIRIVPQESDPYALPPAGARRPFEALQKPPPDEPVDPLAPLRNLGQSSLPSAAPPEPPARGNQSAVRASLRLSSSDSVAGEGIVAMVEVRAASGAARGVVDFIAGGRTLASVPLRVQGDVSQAEWRLVGLRPGLHQVRAAYRGDAAAAPVSTETVSHRVRPR